MNEGAVGSGGDTHHGRLSGRAGATSCSLLGLPVPRGSRAEPAPHVNSLAPPGTPDTGGETEARKLLFIFLPTASQ